MSLGLGDVGAHRRGLPEGEARWAVGFRVSRALGLCVGMLVLGLGVFLLAVCLGEESFSLRLALEEPGSIDAYVIWSLRPQRVLLAALVGAGLAASGTTLQGVLRNPLAEPFMLGVSGGAALGATLALALGLAKVGQLLPGLWGVLAGLSAPALFAFVGAAASLLFVLAVSRGHGVHAPYAALLTGIIFNAFAGAGITFIKVLSSPQRVSEIFHWLVGALHSEPPGTLVLMGLLQAGAVGLMLALSGRLNLLTLGDDDASALGVPVERTRRLLLLAASASVAGAVMLTGLIGFVGLIVPHVLRLAFGPDQRLLVPLSALGGAVFLMLADLLARLSFLVFRQEIPVGLVTVLLGGPLFFVLLARRLRGEGARL